MRIQSGFGILEMLVSLSVLSIMMLALSHMTLNSAKSVKAIGLSDDANQVIASIRMALKNNAICGCNLTPGSTTARKFNVADVSTVTFQVPEVRVTGASCSSGPMIAGVGTRVYSGVIVADMTLKDFFLVSTDTYAAKLIVTIGKPNGNVTSQKVSEILLMFSTNTVGSDVTLTGCGEDVFRGTASTPTNGVPLGAIQYFDLATCPTGWTVLTEAQGRYLVGVNPGGVLGARVGTALVERENRPTGNHWHWVSGYNNIYLPALPGTGTWDAPHPIPTAPDLAGRTKNTFQPDDIRGRSNLVEGTNAPYVQYLVCRKD